MFPSSRTFAPIVLLLGVLGMLFVLGSSFAHQPSIQLLILVRKVFFRIR